MANTCDYEQGRQDGYGAAYSGDPNAGPCKASWFKTLEDYDNYLEGYNAAYNEAMDEMESAWDEGNSE